MLSKAEILKVSKAEILKVSLVQADILRLRKLAVYLLLHGIPKKKDKYDRWLEFKFSYLGVEYMLEELTLYPAWAQNRIWVEVGTQFNTNTQDNFWRVELSVELKARWFQNIGGSKEEYNFNIKALTNYKNLAIKVANLFPDRKDLHEKVCGYVWLMLYGSRSSMRGYPKFKGNRAAFDRDMMMLEFNDDYRELIGQVVN